MNAPPQAVAHIQLDAREVAQIAHASERFSALAIILMTVGPGNGVYDATVAELQRVRETLAKFTDAARVVHALPPIEVLDQAAKKLFPNMATVIAGTNACVIASNYLAKFITVAARGNAERPAPAPPVVVDPKKLN